MAPVPIPKPSFLDTCEYIGVFSGERRWRSPDGKRIYTWDYVHGEIKVFNKWGRHFGVVNPAHGAMIKEAVKGRKINV